MPHITHDAVTLHYEIHGTGERTPLVLTHCLAGHLGLWSDNLAALSRQRRVLVWDCRGHGQSSVPEDASAYGITRSAQDLKALLDALKIDRAHIGGLSMGGGISACFAILFPAHTQSLMVMDSNTAAGLTPTAAVRQSRQMTIASCLAAKSEAHRQAVVTQFIADNPSYRVWHESQLAAPSPDHPVYKAIAGTSPVGLGHTVSCMLDSDFPVERVSEIAMPTMVLAGTQDPGMKAVKITHERIAHSRLTLIDNAGHLSNFDQPRAFENAVLAFLADVER